VVAAFFNSKPAGIGCGDAQQNFPVVTRFEVVLYPPRERSTLPQVDAALSALGRLKVEILLEPTYCGWVSPSPPGRSASARRKIAAAQRTRWAKVRAKKAP